MNPTVSGGTVQISGQSGYACSDYSCWTSPWLGIVPSPQCPPGYAKVVTITPAGWAMAQAGVPPSGSESTRKDLLYLNVPKNPNDYASGSANAPMPLYFQKSTWLRANVYPHGSGANFKGWSAIMGFMYPYSYYKTYIDDLGVTINKDGATSSSQWVVWNLFPVLRRQLEAYVTVYCYFDRKGGLGTIFNSDLVDTTYDQLSNFRAPMSAFRVNYNLSVKARQALVPRREGKISSRVPTRSIFPAVSTTILSAMFKMRS